MAAEGFRPAHARSQQSDDHAAAAVHFVLLSAFASNNPPTGACSRLWLSRWPGASAPQPWRLGQRLMVSTTGTPGWPLRQPGVSDHRTARHRGHRGANPAMTGEDKMLTSAAIGRMTSRPNVSRCRWRRVRSRAPDAGVGHARPNGGMRSVGIVVRLLEHAAPATRPLSRTSKQSDSPRKADFLEP